MVDNYIVFASQEGVVFTLDAEDNRLEQLADIGEGVFGPLCASDGVVYVHTQDLTLHRMDIRVGSILGSISLKSEE